MHNKLQFFYDLYMGSSFFPNSSPVIPSEALNTLQSSSSSNLQVFSRISMLLSINSMTFIYLLFYTLSFILLHANACLEIILFELLSSYRMA